MAAPVFVDTDVFLHWRDASDPSKQSRAADWLTALWRERRGRTSVQVLAEYYSTMTRNLRVTRDFAWRDIEALQSWDPCPLDAGVMHLARELERRFVLSCWDSQIVAAAVAQGCPLLLSGNLRDGSNYDGVVVRNPFVLKVSDEQAALAVPTIRPASSYRRRGRPRARA